MGVSALVQQREAVPELLLVELPAMGHIRNVMQFMPPSSLLKIRLATFMVSRKGKGRSFRRRSKASQVVHPHEESTVVRVCLSHREPQGQVYATSGTPMRAVFYVRHRLILQVCFFNLYRTARSYFLRHRPNLATERSCTEHIGHFR